MRIKSEDCLFVMIDIQDKFLNVIEDIDTVIKNANILNKTTEILNIPLIFTEQYPKGLGNTFSELYKPQHTKVFEKTKFSIFTEEILDYLKQSGRKTLVLYGIEAHICLTQSALDALEHGFKVGYVCDAVASRKNSNKKIAIKRLIQNNIEMLNTEMLLFELVNDAKKPSFKEISNLVK